MNLSLQKIIIDAGTQSRAKIDENVVAEYADRMKDGDQFPPVVVFTDGQSHWLADGFHRFFAAKRCAAPGIGCDVREGTLRDAILFSFSANTNHGLRRTAADKRKSVIAMLQDIEWQDWSDREIARHCGVSHPMVASIRQDLGLEKSNTKFERGGKTITRAEPKAKKLEEEDPVAEFTEAELEREKMQAAVEMLSKQNDELKDQLTIAQAGSTDEIQKEKAESVIKDLRAQIRVLEIELKAVKSSRDQFQAENAQLMKQVQMLQKKIKKLEG